MLFLLLIPLQDVPPGGIEAEYARVWQLFVHGYLTRTQVEAERGYRRSLSADPELAARFQLLEAQAMIWGGLTPDALRVLAAWSPHSADPNQVIEERTLEGAAFGHLQQLPEENLRFSEAKRLCDNARYPACGDLLRAQGVASINRGDFAGARSELLDSLEYARSYHDQFSESTDFLNLGVVSLQSEHFDEAVDWSTSAYKGALAMGAQDLAQNALGNLGWAYFKLGDSEKALNLFLEAEKSAIELGDADDAIKWLATAGYVYQSTGNWSRALESDRQALELGKRINSLENVINCLEDLAHISIKAGNVDQAEAYIDQVNPLIRAGGNRLDALDVLLAKGDIAVARDQKEQAEAIFRAVERDPEAQISMKLNAEHAIALLNERGGKSVAAEHMYRTALATFESARSELKKEDSKLPFQANATDLYDDYIHFLVGQRRTDDALRIADQSRAQTLAQGLGLTTKSDLDAALALHPTEVARKTGATLLFYWLGEKQSYLWAISANKTALFPLPSHREIAQTIEHYRKTLLGFEDPLERPDADGLALYRMLVAPASSLIRSGADVVVLNDGELSQLNFETLIVPGQHPHYWIEDVTLVSAPSLHLLAASHSVGTLSRKLLLFGDAISPNPDYPELLMAAAEMKQIEQHFPLQDQTIYARERATATAYLAANPQQFAYIHFVAHGVASRTDPLDSAIILSRAGAAEDAFKLHARDIIRYPLQARLVTIAACYGSGSRSYAGEGPVGLAWAFLRAGSHNVIGALWEASDESTAQLMGDLYEGIEHGMLPGAALRWAKLNQLHSQREFRKPFYWASFQIYSGL